MLKVVRNNIFKDVVSHELVYEVRRNPDGATLELGSKIVHKMFIECDADRHARVSAQTRTVLRLWLQSRSRLRFDRSPDLADGLP